MRIRISSLRLLYSQFFSRWHESGCGTHDRPFSSIPLFCVHGDKRSSGRKRKDRLQVMVVVMVWHLYRALSIRSNALYNTLRGTLTRLHSAEYNFLRRIFSRCPQFRKQCQTTTARTLCPTLCGKCVGSLTSPANQYTEDAGDGAYGLSSLSEKTKTSNHLEMSLQKKHILLSYFKTLSVGPVWGLNPRPPAHRNSHLMWKKQSEKFCSKQWDWSDPVAIIGSTPPGTRWRVRAR